MIFRRASRFQQHTYFRLGPLSVRRHVSLGNSQIRIAEEVQQAIAEKRPVVALETTIYTHGFPYPDNVALASSLESVVRSNGAVPATIGILDGVARVGLDHDQLNRLAASSQDPKHLLKVSRRDLGYALTIQDDGRAYNGGTTVAATMLLAHLAGIKIFATGGLGGVHRGASETFDISADLTELGRTPVAVIAAGCKAFLDIPKTLEYLETQGVGVITLADGRAGEVDFPGFWSRDSGHTSPMTVRGAVEAAGIIHAQDCLGLQSGILIGNPVPKQFEIPYHQIHQAIDQALEEARAAGATGNRATPFILAKIKELTGRESVTTNRALVEANVRVGSQIAVELAKIRSSEATAASQSASQNRTSRSNSISKAAVQPVNFTERIHEGSSFTPATSTIIYPPDSATVNLFVAGMLAVDLACDYNPQDHSRDRPFELNTSNPARISQSLGGVGHNVALAAHYAGARVHFCSAVADDMHGEAALNALKEEGLSTSGVAILSSASGKRTAQYIAVNDGSKNLVVAMADMDTLSDLPGTNIVHDLIQNTWLAQMRAQHPAYTILDANWSLQNLSSWIKGVKEIGSKLIFEPVSNAKSTNIFNLPVSPGERPHDTLGVFPETSLYLASPNLDELNSMYMAARAQGFFESQAWWNIIDAFGISSAGARPQMIMMTNEDLVDRGVPQQCLQLLPYIPCIVTKLGAQGVLLTQILPANDTRLTDRSYAPYILSRCKNGSEDVHRLGGVYMRLFPPPEVVDGEDIVSVNGAGDSFLGTLAACLAKYPQHGAVEQYIDVAQRASAATLKSKAAVGSSIRRLFQE